MRLTLAKFKVKYFDRSVLRWAAVGITTTAIDYLIFIALYGSTSSVFGSNLIASIFATSFNYLTHHRWTFKSNQQHVNTGVRYLLNLSFWWIVSSSVIKTLITIGVDPKLAKLVPLILIVPINYFVLNKIVFNKKIRQRLLF
jgi:putative flippase GtrA